MRLAIFSDIHGNPIALDAVLADIQARGGADAYLVLGDAAIAAIQHSHHPSGDYIIRLLRGELLSHWLRKQ